MDENKFQCELDVVWEAIEKDNVAILKKKYGLSDSKANHMVNHSKQIMNMERKYLDIHPDEKVLEIGSGAGKVVLLLSQKGVGVNLVVSDIAVKELKGLRKCYNLAREHELMGYVGLLANRLPFRANSFDVIVIMDVVEHFYHGEFVELLKELRKILKPSGRLYVQTPNGLRYAGKLCKMNDRN